MAEFIDIAPVMLSDSPDVERVLNTMVMNINDKLRDLSVDRAGSFSMVRGTPLLTFSGTGEKTVKQNIELAADLSSGLEEFLGEWPSGGDRPMLLLARGAYSDTQTGSKLTVRVREHDLAGEVLDEVTTTLDTAGAERRTVWTSFVLRQTPIIAKRPRTGTDVIVRRVSQYVLTGQASSHSAAAAVRDLNLISIGLV